MARTHSGKAEALTAMMDSQDWPPWRAIGNKISYYDDLSFALIIASRAIFSLPILYILVAVPCAWLPAVRTHGFQKYFEFLPSEPRCRKFLPLYIIGGAAFLIALCSLINWLIYIVFLHGAEAGAPPQDPNAGFLATNSGFKLVSFFLMAVIFTPIYEELTYRLLLPRILSRFFPYNASAVIVSIFFAFLHRPFSFVPAMFYFAITQCAIQRRYGTLAAIATHALYNAGVFFILS